MIFEAWKHCSINRLGTWYFAQLPQNRHVRILLELWLPAIIVDKPRTVWLDLLIDTSHHFLSIDTIPKNIDEMAM